jgi:hypothetical protein
MSGGYNMIVNQAYSGDSKSPERESVITKIEQREQMENALSELYALLEQYAPSWYSERLRTRLSRFCASPEPGTAVPRRKPRQMRLSGR